MRRFFIAIVTAALLSAIPFAVSAQTVDQNDPHYRVDLPSDPVGAMNTARDRVAAGKLDAAITGLQSYVANHPGEIGPQRLLGDLYFRKTELQLAEATYKNILTYSPYDKETHNRLGSVYATENRLDDAIAEFNRSLPGTDAVPDLVRLHIRRGDLNIYKHRLDLIANEYPTSAEAQSEAGEMYEATNEPEVAERYFKRALDNDPGNLIALNSLGLAYMDQQRFSEAIKIYGSCLAHDPYNYACKDNLAAVYLHEGEWSHADVLLQQAHRLEPERWEALVNMGYLSDRRGDWKKAIEYYVQATTVYPYAPEAYVNLGVTYNEHDLYQLSQAALIKGLSVAPEDGRLHFILGEAYSAQGNDTMASAQYRAAALASDLDESLKRTAQLKVMALNRPRPTSTPQ